MRRPSLSRCGAGGRCSCTTLERDHPLAGQTLHVAVLVHHVRGATAEDLINGQAGEAEAPEPTYLA
jgi:hypothetical protein